MRVVSTMTFWQEIALTFKEIGWLPAILLVAGLVLVIVDMYTANLGKIGVPGAILAVIAIVLRMHKHGAGNPVIQLFTMLCVCIICIGIAIVVMVICTKKGWIPKVVGEKKQSPKVQVGEASVGQAPTDNSSAEREVITTDIAREEQDQHDQQK